MAKTACPEAQLARRLGLFDTTMIVMGGIIGSGIFINPYVVAQQVPSAILILAAWTFGGLIASYAAGLPFFRGTAESDFLFSLAFFSVPLLVQAVSERMHGVNGPNVAA